MERIGIIDYMKFTRRVTITQVVREVRMAATAPVEERCPQCGFDLTPAHGLKPVDQLPGKLAGRVEASKVEGER